MPLTAIRAARDRGERQALDAALKDAVRRRFEVLAAWSVDRLGRSLQDLVATLQDLRGAVANRSRHPPAPRRRPRHQSHRQARRLRRGHGAAGGGGAAATGASACRSVARRRVARQVPRCSYFSAINIRFHSLFTARHAVPLARWRRRQRLRARPPHTPHPGALPVSWPASELVTFTMALSIRRSDTSDSAASPNEISSFGRRAEGRRRTHRSRRLRVRAMGRLCRQFDLSDMPARSQAEALWWRAPNRNMWRGAPNAWSFTPENGKTSWRVPTLSVHKCGYCLDTILRGNYVGLGDVA
jgi:hypothetical protein